MDVTVHRLVIYCFSISTQRGYYIYQKTGARSALRYDCKTGIELRHDSKHEQLKGNNVCCCVMFEKTVSDYMYSSMFLVLDRVKLKPAKNSTQPEVKAAVLKSVEKKYAWDAQPLLPEDVCIKSLDIQDMRIHNSPCYMCGEKGTYLCIWICCGHVACVTCAQQLYRFVHPFGVCPRCQRVFPAGWSVHDMLAPLSVEQDELTDADVYRLREKKKNDKKDLGALFRKMV
jgi:hypothetical protein